MLKVLRVGATTFDAHDLSQPLPADSVWLDLLHPTVEEEQAVERFLGLSLPTREDMVEIEPSSRLYQEDGALVMTASVLTGWGELPVPVLEPFTFVLAKQRLVTIRYADPKPFRLYAAQAERTPHLCATGVLTFVNLLEAIIDRAADILERTSAEVEEVSSGIFDARKADGFEKYLAKLGRAQNVVIKARESLVSLARLISFCQASAAVGRSREAKDMLASQERDVRSLTDHTSALAGNIAFLLDAALGFINIEQNRIIKVFSIFTVCLMPPTLIGAIYGMNFDHMPELRLVWAYPAVLLLMLVSGVAPLIWFWRTGRL